MYSAGIELTSIDLRAIELMKEQGIDISQQKSKSMNDYLQQNFDYIITVCDEVQVRCPFFPGNAVRIRWNVKDPAKAKGTSEEILLEHRRVRDEIVKKIDEFFSKSF